jgi:hypothetical protein
LADGTLVQVLAGVIGAEMQIALVYPERAFLPPQVRAFIEAVAAWVPRELAANRPSPQRAAPKPETGAKTAVRRPAGKGGSGA